MSRAPLWLAARLPALPLEALASTDPEAVVVQARGSRRWIIAAAGQELPPGLDLGLARVRRPALVALERQPACEIEALENLACAAYSVGERITWRIEQPEGDYALPGHTLWLDIGPSLQLFGGLEPVTARLDDDFRALGHRADFGIAPTLEAAAALAHSRRPPVLDAGALPARLATLPLTALALSRDGLALLTASGLHRLDAVLELPREALALRLSREDLNVFDRLLGRCPDPRPPWQPPVRFQRRLNLDTEVEDSERLVFPLRRLILGFSRYLQARATGVQQFQLCLGHRQTQTTLDLCLSAPGRDEALLLRVLRERLAALALPAPVISLQLRADRFAPPAAAQRDFFDRRAQTEEAAAAVIDRLRARLGEAAIWRPQLVEDHRPEQAWRPARPEAPHSQAPPPATARPLWLLREAQRLEPPRIAGTPERIESGWWDGGDVRRDYFRCTLEDGRRGWVYRDLRSGQSWLQGLW